MENLTEGPLKAPRQPQTFTICLSRSKRNRIYKSESIFVDLDSVYNPDSAYSVLLRWNSCCPAYVGDFVQTVCSLARRNRLATFLTSSKDLFLPDGSIETVGELIFRDEVPVTWCDHSITGTQGWTLMTTKDWRWDPRGCFILQSGKAFIKVEPTKKLVLWKDNAHELRKEPRDIMLDYMPFAIRCTALDVCFWILKKAEGNDHHIQVISSIFRYTIPGGTDIFVDMLMIWKQEYGFGLV